MAEVARGPRLPGGQPHDLRQRAPPWPATSRCQDCATVGAFSAVHQFCRVGVHAFVGGYTVATKDVLPFSKTVGNRACIYGVNGVGLQRRGFSAGGDRRHPPGLRVLLQSRPQHPRGRRAAARPRGRDARGAWRSSSSSGRARAA